MISLHRLKLPIFASSVSIAFLFSPAGAQSKLEPFTDGDKWCAVGDENTQLGRYPEWIELFYLTRYPGERVQFINRGVSGDTASAALKRLDWDVLGQNPTVVSLFFGQNDAGPELYSTGQRGPEIEQQRKERLDAFQTSTRELVDRLKKAEVRVVLMSPFPVMGPANAELDAALRSMSRFLIDLAAENDLAFVDVHASIKRVLAERNVANPAFLIAGPDGIRPSPVGQFLIAHCFLEASGVTPDVSRLAVDLNTGMVTEAVNGRVESVFKSTDRLTFTWTENSLPFPIDDSIRQALAVVPFQETMNRQILSVVGLPAGVYELEVDGVRVGLFPTQELEGGVNLASQRATPHYQQSILVSRMVAVRNELVADNLRSLAWTEHTLGPDLNHPVEWSEIRPLLEQRMDEIAAGDEGGVDESTVTLYPKRKANEAESWAESTRMAQQARKAAIPRSHLYSLRAVR